MNPIGSDRYEDPSLLSAVRDSLARVRLSDRLGRVKQVIGLLIEADLPGVELGEVCELIPSRGEVGIGEVVGFTPTSALLSSMTPLDGVSADTLVRPLGTRHVIDVDEDPFGEIRDGFGRVMSRLRPRRSARVPAFVQVPVIRDGPAPMERGRIIEPMHTGVRAIDAFTTFGYGQRVGLFAGPGCGKTTLMAAIARGAEVDAIVFGLIGERGRELREFVEHELDEHLLSRSVVVCATSDRTSMERARAASTATAIAEALRDRGLRVLLLIDSLTRFARAQRELGLAAGEPPARAGFPPSVYAMLPRLTERAGNASLGSITAIYTVLAEGEGPPDPISEEVKSLVDGHVHLSRKLAEQGHFPAIDVLASLSRIMGSVVSPAHRAAALRARGWMAKYREIELLVRVGEYRKGADQTADDALAVQPALTAFLRQDTRLTADFAETLETLGSLTP